MYKKILFFCLLMFTAAVCFAQENADAVTSKPMPAGTTAVDSLVQPSEVPVISYTFNKKKYGIADIKVTGAKNYDDFVLIGFSGLSVGDRVSIPGEEMTAAVKKFWKHGLFSDVKMLATKMTEDSVWLEIKLTPRPTISEVQINGVKKGERDDLLGLIGMAKGTQVTPNLVNRAKLKVKEYFEGKGFSNVDVDVKQKDDVTDDSKILLEVNVDKNEKTKIHSIAISGNKNLDANTLKLAMKKTNEGFNLQERFKLSVREMFSTKKFVDGEYKNDLENIILKYNSMGYRDARIVSDSVVKYDDKHVNIYINVDEGDKYFIRDIRWVGNTLYPTERLEYILNMKPGDVYNQTKLNNRLVTDEDAVSNVYYNNGYIFSHMDPVETYVENDSVDIEVRVVEGPQATINRIRINGNDRLYEDIIRRELMTKPGQLFSKDALMRSLRELAQMGHFDPENLNPDVQPNADNGTVDIAYNLVSKANDQVEFSAGWGQTGVIGRLSLKFTNFSMKNLLNPGSYKGIIPQGEGQTLTLSGQTNGRYYQAYSIAFMDPWFGGKRPNTFSASASYMIQTGMSERSSTYNNYSMYNYGGSYSPYSSYGGYGYGNYSYDPNKYFRVFAVSLGYGKRLSWPDDYFSAMAELSFQRYMMKNWYYFVIQDGNCNNLNLTLTLSRNSTDNPLYTRKGSQFSASVTLTPPFSLWDGKDYASMSPYDGSKFTWIEYHKWKFKGKIFMPLANPETVTRTPVLMGRVEYGFLGSYNSNKVSPFETFAVGGDGMTGYSSYYATETVGLRGYPNGSLTPTGSEGYAYSRFAMELRYPFLLEPTSTIYGLGFVEAGNAWHDIKSFSPFNLRRSAGVGVRIFLPMIGLMGIDWAYGFDRASLGINGNTELHFILGQEF